MAGISEHTKEIRAEIRQVKLEEAADALITILEDHAERWSNTTVPKKNVISAIPDVIEQMRCNNGVCEIPAIENREVAIANESFCRSNWGEIRRLCSEYGYFIIWNPPGERVGIRLGTIEEFQRQQGHIVGIAQGFADFHNERSDIIEDHGEEATQLRVRIRDRHNGQ
jgi:hypothetical protein